MRSILRNFHPKRSGDIYLVFEPYVFINDFDGLTVASTHGSPWRYDTYVPVMFAGGGLGGPKGQSRDHAVRHRADAGGSAGCQAALGRDR